MKLAVTKKSPWKFKVTTEEIYAFIGLLLLLGITKKSDVSIEYLWKADSLNYTPLAGATMSTDRKRRTFKIEISQCDILFYILNLIIHMI